MRSVPLWGRRWRILVTDKEDAEALNVSDLHCIFEVHKKMERGGFYAMVRIYNMNAETENKIIEEGDRLVIEAGYAGSGQENDIGQYGKIFDGQIIYASRRREGNTDYILTLSAIDGDLPLNLNYIAKTVNKGINQRQVIETVCSISEEKTPVAEITGGLSEQQLPRGKVFFGRPFDYIEDVCRGNGALYYVEDGALTVTKLSDVNEDEALVISPETGLIGLPQQVEFGVTFKTLLNPAIRMKTKIKLSHTEVNEREVTPGQNGAKQMPLDEEWIYQACEVVHRGDTRGEEWYTEVQGLSRHGKGSLPAIMANEHTNANGV